MYKPLGPLEPLTEEDMTTSKEYDTSLAGTTEIVIAGRFSNDSSIAHLTAISSYQAAGDVEATSVHAGIFYVITKECFRK